MNRNIDGMIADIWKTMRPNHWLKNVFVLAPLFFSGSVTDIEKVKLTALAFVAFCLMTSAASFLNDILDRHRDKAHPVKCKRPIAAGAIGIPLAISIAAIFCACSLALSWSITPAVAGILASYAFLNIAYSSWLKHVVIADVFCIALGFVFRVVAGAFSIGVHPTAWIVMATFLLSLFLGLAKRRNELLLPGMESTEHRPILDAYTPRLVDELISVVTPITLITYILYTLDPATTERFHSNYLYATSIFVIFGIFRYLYLMHRENLGGSPTDVVVKDGPMLGALIGWVATFTLFVYLG